MSETLGKIVEDKWDMKYIELPKEHKMVCGQCGSRDFRIYRPVQLPPAPEGVFIFQCGNCPNPHCMTIHPPEKKGEGYDKYGVEIPKV